MDIGIIQQKAEEMRILNLAVMKDGELLLKKDWDEEIRKEPVFGKQELHQHRSGNCAERRSS